MSEYIKRDDAIRMVRLQGKNAQFDGMAQDVAPVRHGRWVEQFKVIAPPALRSRWTCSWCGNVQTYGATDYCPNCGARMDGGNDEVETMRWKR